MLALRLPVLDDMSRVLAWRNSPEVATFMYRDDLIPPAEHEEWFPSTVVDRPNSLFRVAEWASEPIGWMSLTRIDLRNRSCEWGGYLAPSAPRGEGLGRRMLSASLDLAFNELQLNRVMVEVLVHNQPAIGLYDSMGFVREGLLRERAWQLAGPRDALLYSMLAGEWMNHSR